MRIVSSFFWDAKIRGILCTPSSIGRSLLVHREETGFYYSLSLIYRTEETLQRESANRINGATEEGEEGSYVVHNHK